MTRSLAVRSLLIPDRAKMSGANLGAIGEAEDGRARKHGQTMHLDLSDAETAALADLLRATSPPVEP